MRAGEQRLQPHLLQRFSNERAALADRGRKARRQIVGEEREVGAGHGRRRRRAGERRIENLDRAAGAGMWKFEVT